MNDIVKQKKKLFVEKSFWLSFTQTVAVSGTKHAAQR